MEGFFTNPLRTLKTYALGRGLISMGVMGATLLTGGTNMLAIGLVALGGVVLTGLMRMNAQAIYENNMVGLYRGDIAERLGIAPEEVTRAHLHEAAKHNEVIDQALKRQRQKNYIAFGTALLAGVVTFGLLQFGGLHLAVKDLMVSQLGPVAQYLSVFSMGIVAGLSSLVVHDGLEAYLGAKTGISKAAAHDRIVAMEKRMARGWSIGKEHVYEVLVAGNPQLRARIAQEFGKDYASMGPTEQGRVLEVIGVAEDMQLIAREINAGRLRPGQLAYMIGDVVAQYHMPQTPGRLEQITGQITGHVVEPARNFATQLTRHRPLQQGEFAAHAAQRRAASPGLFTERLRQQDREPSVGAALPLLR